MYMHIYLLQVASTHRKTNEENSEEKKLKESKFIISSV